MPTVPPIDHSGDDEPLPGLDDDPIASELPPAAIESPTDGLSHRELDDWYYNEYGGDAKYEQDKKDSSDANESVEKSRQDAMDRAEPDLAPVFQRVEEAYDAQAHLGLPMFGGGLGWDGLSLETKTYFRDEVVAGNIQVSASGWFNRKRRLVDFIVVAGGVMIVLVFLVWFFNNGPGSNTPTAAEEAVQQADTEEAVVEAATEEAVSDEPETAAGNETGAAAETEEEPSGGLTIPATTIGSFAVGHDSYIFTVEVDGNGKDLAEDLNTKWYNPRFKVTTTTGSFAVDVKWEDGGEFEARAFESTDLRGLIVDASVTGEWTADDTFVIVADNLGIDDAPVSAILELTVRITDESGENKDYEDTAEWES